MKSNTAHILISRKCVNRCIFCTVAGQRERGEFPHPESIRTFMINMATAGIGNIVFSGLGEPTLDSNFESYLWLASELGFDSICLFTNGFGLTPQKASQWRNSGLSSVLVSVHGIKEDHDRVVQRDGSFDEAILAINIYLEENIKVNINTCMTRSNLLHLPELSQMLVPYPIGKHTFSFLEWTGNVRGNPPFVPDYGEVADRADSLIATDDPVTIFNNIPFCMVRRQTREQTGTSTVQLLNGSGELSLDPIKGKIFPKICSQRRCRWFKTCPGFELNYIQERGWQDIEVRVKSYLHSINDPTAGSRHRYNSNITSPTPSTVRDHRLETCPQVQKDLVVVIKPTNRCNGACRYCSSHSTHPTSRLTIDLVRILYREVFDYAYHRGINRVTFLWHGGEPLLMGTAFYEQAWKLSRTDRIKVRHMMQSNLLALNPEWVALLQKFDVPISTSIDPIANERIKKDGLPQYPDWLTSFLLACEARLNLGLVFTVTSQHIGRADELYSFLRNLQSLASKPIGARINPVYPTGKAADCANRHLLLQPQEYGEFLVKIGQLYQRDDQPFPLYPIKEWLDGQVSSCEFSGNCQERFIALNGNGDIFHCGRFSDSVAPLGNLCNEKLRTILDHSERAALRRRSSILRDTSCNSCSYWHLCKGGCAYHSYINCSEGCDATPFCSAYKHFFEQNGLSKTKKQD